MASRQRNKNFTKDTKVKTAKCRVCGQRVTNFSQKCGDCNNRICSECLEPAGQSVQGHKDIAHDYYENGCWCGFASGFNPAFQGKIPPVVYKPTVKKVKKEPKVPRDPSTAHDKTSAANTTAHEASNGDAATSSRPGVHSDAAVAADSAKRKRSIEELVPASDVQISKRPRIPADRRSTTTTANTTAPNASNGDASSSSLSDPPSSLSSNGPSSSQGSSGSGSSSGSSKRAGRSSGPPKAQPALPGKKKKASEDVIIISAGVIGLFIALELAKKDRANEKTRVITVVDVNERAGRLASGNCAGVISHRGLNDASAPLVDRALAGWAKLFDEEADFWNAVDFQDDIMTADNAETQAEAKILSWAKANNLTGDDEQSFGFLDSASLVSWLPQRCEALGVVFKFNSLPTRIDRDRANEVTGVRVKGVHASENSAKVLPCSKLVLAVGAFTPALFKRLCPGAETSLPPTYVQEAHWTEWTGITIPNNERHTAVLLNEKPSPAEPTRAISMVPRRRSTGDVIRVSMVQKSAKSKVNTIYAMPSEQPHLCGDIIKNFRQVSERHLVLSKLNETGKGICLGHGASYISTPAGDGKPVMAVHEEVWLAYGFGMHGTTLAPGVGEYIAQKLHGEETKLDW